MRGHILLCSLDYMREHGQKIVPIVGLFWKGGARIFINNGVNGRWLEVLTEVDNAAYNQTAREQLGEAYAQWLASVAPKSSQ